MSQVNWKDPVSGGFTTGSNWDTGNAPGAGDDAVIGVAGSYTVSLITSVTIGSLTISDGQADLSIANPGGTDAVTGNLSNAGRVDVDSGTGGGSSLLVGGTLTNSNQMFLGDGGITAPVSITVGALDDTGTMGLTGNVNGVAAGTATLQVGTAAGFGTLGTLTGTFNMNGLALLEFTGGGQIVDIVSGAQLQMFGGSLLADSSDTTHNSALTGLASNAGYLNIGNGEVLTVDGNLDNTGRFDVDSGSGGGSEVTVTGTLTNSGQMFFGNGGVTSPITVTIGTLDNTGSMNLTGSVNGVATGTATVQVGTAAGFGTLGTLTGTVNLNGAALLEFTGGGEIATIANGAQLQLFGGSLLADGTDTAHNSALTGLTTNAGYLNIGNGEMLTIDDNFEVTGRFDIDSGSAGGSNVTVTGTLTNSGQLFFGNGGISSPITVSLGAFDNTGQLDLTGNFNGTPAGTATVLIGTAAGFGSTGTLTGTVNMNGLATLEFTDNGEINTIATGAQLQLFGASLLADATDTTHNSALTGLSTIAGYLNISNGDVLNVTGDLDVTGRFDIDSGGAGGSTVTIGGTLTNSNDLFFGNGGLSAPIVVTVAALDNIGQLNLTGNFSTPADSATLHVGTVAGFGTTGTLTGTVNMNGAATLEFTGNGEIATIATGAQLQLFGGSILADATDTTHNSALTGLSTIAGYLNVSNGEVLNVTGDLDVTGRFDIDSGGNGGSSVTIGGTLTNSNDLFFGNGGLSAPIVVTVAALDNIGQLNLTGNFSTPADSATLHVGTVAVFGTAGTLTGTVNMNGAATLEFTDNGEINTIVTGAQLQLFGLSLLADASDTTHNSALTGLSTIAGYLNVSNGEVLNVTGDLDVTGRFDIDSGGNGGSSVTIGGTLTNSNDLFFGNGGLSAPIVVTVAALDNIGQLNLTGNFSTPPDSATLHVGTVAGFGTAGTLTGTVNMNGAATLEFTDNGEINTIATGAQLQLFGLSLLADASDTTHNSALTGLSTIAGYLNASYGEVLNVTGDLDVTGRFDIDSGGAGGSTVTIGGTLTNSNLLIFGNGGLSAPIAATVGAFDNTGQLNLIGNFNGAPADTATLQIGTAAGFGTAGVLTGQVNLNGVATLEFTGGGEITSIASGAQLQLFGASLLADTSDPTHNSALTGLADIAGYLNVGFGEVLNVGGNLDVTGRFDVDSGSTGGSDVTVAGTLTNSNLVIFGNAGITSPVTVTLGGLSNSGTFNISGNTSGVVAGITTVTINGAATNSGQINLAAEATLDVTGTNTFTQTAGTIAVTGAFDAGSINFSNSLLQIAGGEVQAASLTIGSGATLSDSGGLSIATSGAAANTMDIGGGAVSLSGGTITVSGGSGLTIGTGVSVIGAGSIKATVTDGGLLEAQNGLLLLSNGIAAGGKLAIDSAATLDLGTTTGATIAFLGATGTLKLETPASNPGSLDGFVQGSTIDLVGVNATGATPLFDAGTDTTAVTVDLVVGGPLTFTLAGDYSGATFATNQQGADSLLTVGNIAVDQPPSIAAPPSLLAQQATSINVTGVTISDPDAVSGNQTETVTLKDTGGTLSANTSATGGGGTITGSGSDDLIVSGLLGQVNADLQSLSYQNADAGSDTIVIAANDGHGGNAPGQSIPVTINAPPVITVPGAQTSFAGIPSPIGVVSVADADAVSANETITVTVTDTNGQLSATAPAAGGGGTISGAGSNQLTISGQLSQVDADLSTLSYVGTKAGPDTIGVNANDGRGGFASQTISMTVAPPPPPTITAPGLVYVGDQIESPIDGVSIAVGAGLSASTTITLDLTDTAGGLALTDPAGASVSGGGTSLSLEGDEEELDTALASLIYTGAASTLQLSATEDGSTAATATTSIQLPATQDPFYPNAAPATIMLQNSSDVIAGTGTAALLQWDQGGLGYVGKVYVNLPLGGIPAQIGFSAYNGDALPNPMNVSGQVEPFAPEGGQWQIGLAGVDNVLPLAFPVSLGTIQIDNPVQSDTITLEFNSNFGGGPTGLPDRRVEVVFNHPTTSVTVQTSGSDSGGTSPPPTTPTTPTTPFTTITTTTSSSNGNGGNGGGGGGSTGNAWGDVHVTTFDGLAYGFQAAGEFILAKSTMPGDTYQVQIRLTPFGNSSTVSVVTEVAVGIGNNRVTFDVNRANTVWVDGQAVSLVPGGKPLDLGPGTLHELTGTSWEILYDSGETVTITDNGSYLTVQTSLSRKAPKDSVEGLLGNDSGNPANDLTLADGTVLPQPLSFAQEYSTFADAWRVTQQNSLFDYGPGQSTTTFTDENFPADSIPLSSLPASVVQSAQAQIAAAGITDPAVAQGVLEDYLLTGDPSFISADAQIGATQKTTDILPEPVNPSASGGVGIAAVQPDVIETASGPTEVDFTVYRTSSTANAQVVDYQVVAPLATYLGAGFFSGDVLPSGQVTIAAGQTSVPLALDVTGSLGTAPSGILAVAIDAGQSGTPVVVTTASVSFNNDQLEPGVHAAPAFLDPSGIGTFTQNGTNWTLDLGDVPTGATPLTFEIDVANNGAADANVLFGTLKAGGSGVAFGTGLPPIVGINGGQVLELNATIVASPGDTIDRTVTFNANERNESGYSASLGDMTLTITGVVEGSAAATINTASPVTFGNLHEGVTASAPVSITNSGTSAGVMLDAATGIPSPEIIEAGRITGLAPGATDATDITVGLNTNLAGVHNGTATVTFASDGGTSTFAPLKDGKLTVTGTVYREALPSLPLITETVHVKDPGTLALTVSNADPNDGFSEQLIASLAGATGGVSVQSGGPTGEIAPGASSNALAIGFSTAAAGVVSGSVSLGAISDGGTGAGSIDGLGQTVLPTQQVSAVINVNNFAVAALEQVAGRGTFTRNGDNYTLDLGTIGQGTAPVTVDLGALNAASGLADALSGSFQLAGSSAFTTAGFQAFSGLVQGQSDTAPQVTLDTTNTGTFTETVTMHSAGSNASGYSAAQPDQILTITGTVAVLPPLVINAPATQIVFATMAGSLGALSITDPSAGTAPMTVTIADNTGILNLTASNAVVVAGNETNSVTLTGDLADINTTLASLTYTGANEGTDVVTIGARDSNNLTASQLISVGIDPVPATAAVFNEPASEIGIIGKPTGLYGLSLTDPGATSTGELLTLTLTDPAGTLSTKGGSGGIVTGEGTSTLTITGTVDQINSYLADDIVQFLIGQLSNFETKPPFPISGVLASKSGEDLVAAAGGPEGKFFQVGVLAASYALNALISLIPGNGPAPTIQQFYQDLAKILIGWGDPHIVTSDGTIYNFDAVGEFVLATSTLSGDSFDVQVRMQPLNGSEFASVITQVAAAVGTDRVTFGLGRADVVWVDGVASTLSTTNPVNLNGGQLVQLSSDSYQITWNTGEVLTVFNAGDHLNVEVAPGANDTDGSLVGLGTLTSTQGNEFTLPDGTVLPQPLTTAQLYGIFANAWRVPQQFSLFDYATGQTTATFTDTSFPLATVSLSDLPASVVAGAAAAIAAAGISDPGIAAAAELDYLTSGGNPTVLTSDASLFTSISTTQAGVTPSGAPPTAIGVIADQPSVLAADNGTTPVVFDVYLTAPAATATEIDYTVDPEGPGFLDATAFGGTLPSNSVMIAAGATTGQFTINLPQGALGTLATENLGVSISNPDGVPVFVSTAQDTIKQKIAGPPPVPQFADLTNFGNFSGSGNSYTLDLGAIQYGQPLPPIEIELLNAAQGASDDLSGTFNVVPIDGYSVSGTSLPAPLAAGQSYQGIFVNLTMTKFGSNSETITFNGVDSNPTGFSQDLAPLTLTIKDTIVPPSMVFSQAWGDVHIITYNGLHYDFQAVGEFTLAQSHIPGDSFDIQLRLQQWSVNSSVTVITQTAVSVGSDRVTFDNSRPNTPWVDGQAISVDQANPVMTLADGSITWISQGTYQVNWNTGEEATITQLGSYQDVTDGIPLSEPDLVSGLQGEDAGQQNDFQLPDGTVLPQPLSSATLYGPFANGWRVTQATSLFDYAPGQTTATFTDLDFPPVTVSLASLPQNVVAQAAAAVAATGITDPGIAQAAELDYIATGDPTFIGAAAEIQKLVPATTTADVIQSTPPVPAIGVDAAAASLTEAAIGPTQVTFNAYLTGTSATDTVVNYTVVAAGAGFLGAADFGGTLPTGQVTIAAGQTTQPFTIDVPAGALGSLPADDLQVQVSGPAGTPLFAATAQTEIVNPQPEPGTPAVPELIQLGGPGTLTQNGANYTLDLGTVPQGAGLTTIQLAVVNAATAPADDLTGTFSPPAGSGFIIVGNNLAAPIAAGQSYTGLYVGPETYQLGKFTESMVFSPVDSNASGFQAALPAITLTVEETIASPAAVGLNSPQTILFPNVRVSSPDNQAVSITNTAPPPAALLDITASTGGAATAFGAISGLAAGQTDATDLSVGLNTSGAGSLAGLVTLNASSDGGAGATEPLSPSPTIDLFGAVYRPAAPATIAPINEIVHVKDPGTAAPTVSNTDPADGFSENLIAALTGTTGGIGIASAGPAPKIGAGASDSTSLAVSFDTSQAGSVSGTVTVGLTSDGGTGVGSIDGLGQIGLSSQIVAVNVTVDNFAAPALQELSGGGTFTQTGNNYSIDLGDVPLGASLTAIQIGVLNGAAAPADNLTGDFTPTGPEGISGFGSFSGLAAGSAALSAGTVTVNTNVLGDFSETITLDPTDSNASGFSEPLDPVTLTISGTVTHSLGQVFLLTRGPDIVSGGSGDDTIMGGSGTPSSGDNIDGGGGTNTLELTGPGTFDLRAPATLVNIATITATEGQSAFVGNGEAIGAENQIVVLRDGLDAVVQVAAAASLNEANPKASTITIVGAHNADVIDLASGNDVVTVGDTRETVNGGTGNDTIHVTAATIGATIDGGSGQSTLNVTGGGTVAMGGSVTNIATVLLSPAAGAYNFSANTISGLTIDDANTGPDVLQAGASNQTLTGGASGATMIGSVQGGDVFKDPAAALNGDTIEGFAAPNNVIDFTDVDFAMLQRPVWTQSSTSAGSLFVTDGTRSASVTLFGQFAAAGFQGVQDNGTGSEITYQPPQTQTAIATPH